MQEKRDLIVEKKNDDFFIDIELLKNEAQKETLLYEFCREFGFNSDQIKGILNSLKGISGKIWYTSTHKAIKDRNHIIISKLEPVSDCEELIFENTKKIFEPVSLGFKRLTKTAEYQIMRSSQCAHVDAGLLKYPLELRRVKTGDSFVPFGMKGRKKLSDFFTDIKLNANQKEKTFVLVSNNEIVWVVGHRVDNRYAVTDKTIEILEIEVL